jgi:N-acetylglucosaminyl-diphospho-decaprenol L-rhamnosyltransferase
MSYCRAEPFAAITSPFCRLISTCVANICNGVIPQSVPILPNPGPIPVVSVVVLSFNRPDLLRQNLASLRQQLYSSLEIIVVDNASPASDEIAQMVGEQAGIRLLRNPFNLGFTGGMNVGLAAAHGHYVCLTEDDMTLAPDCLARLVEHMKQNPKCGVASGVMFNLGDNTIRYNRGSLALGVPLRIGYQYGEGERQPTDPYVVEWIPGAMVFSRLDYLRALGGFREDFFMYFEDVELCLRVARSGCSVMIVPSAKVFHFPPPPASFLPNIEYHKLKNVIATYLLHASWTIIPVFFLKYGVWTLIKMAWMRDQRLNLHFRAIAWNLRHLSALLKERRSIYKMRLRS